MHRIIISILLIIAPSFSFAGNCLCKEVESAEFVRKSCPTVQPATVSDAKSINLWFQSTRITNFRALIADFSGTRVCIAESATSTIGVKISPPMPWPEIVEGIAKHYGLVATINRKEILIKGTLK